MMQLLTDIKNKIQILLWAIFSPATLFHRLSRLNWYGATLSQWIDGYLEESNQRLLEVGSASGDLCAYIWRKGYQAVGVDTSNRMLKVARMRYPEITFYKAEGNQLPFEDNAFDVVAAASVVNIVPDPDKLVKQMRRVCKRGGRITVLFPSADFNSGDLYRLTNALALTGFSRTALRTWHRLAPKLSVEMLKNMLTRNGLMQIQSRFYLCGMVAEVSGRIV